MHAEQLSHTGAAALAAETGCASADHLEHVDEAGAKAMAAASVVGVLLPTATLSTRGGWDNARVLREAGVTLALGTDCNPGTSWCESVPYALQLAAPLLGLTVPEAIRAATAGGGAALRRPELGVLRLTHPGDLLVLEAEHEADLLAHLGAPGRAHHDRRRSTHLGRPHHPLTHGPPLRCNGSGVPSGGPRWPSTRVGSGRLRLGAHADAAGDRSRRQGAAGRVLRPAGGQGAPGAPAARAPAGRRAVPHRQLQPQVRQLRLLAHASPAASWTATSGAG